MLLDLLNEFLEEHILVISIISLVLVTVLVLGYANTGTVCSCIPKMEWGYLINITDDYANLKCQQMQYIEKEGYEIIYTNDSCPKNELCIGDRLIYMKHYKNFTAGHILNSTHVECWDLSNCSPCNSSMCIDDNETYEYCFLYSGTFSGINYKTGEKFYSQIFSIDELLSKEDINQKNCGAGYRYDGEICIPNKEVLYSRKDFLEYEEKEVQILDCDDDCIGICESHAIVIGENIPDECELKNITLKFPKEEIEEIL